MAVTYGFFNSVNGDRKYNADTMSEFYTGICTQGVFQHVDNGLAVSAGTGLTVNVASGRAIIQGHWVKNDAALTLSIDAASATYARIDAVVIRYSASNRNIQIVVKTGTPAASPSAPSMTRAGGVYEMCLAYVNVAANATSVTVTDKRSNSSVCGWAAVAQATSGEVDQMLNDMKTGFDGEVYDSPGAAVRACDQELQNQIATGMNAVLKPATLENLVSIDSSLITSDIFLKYNNGQTASSNGAHTSDFITLLNYSYFRISGTYQGLCAGLCVYDANETFIASEIYDTTAPVTSFDELIYTYQLIKKYPTAVYVRFSSLSALGVLVAKNAPNDFLHYLEYAADVPNTNSKLYSVYDSLNYPAIDSNMTALDSSLIENNVFLKYHTGTTAASSGAQTTGFLVIANYEYFKVKVKYQGLCAGMCVYTADQTFIASEIYNTDSSTYYETRYINMYELKKKYPTAVYVRFSSLETLVCNYNSPTGRQSLAEILNNTISEDILSGKKYYALGDSFTHGDWTGYSGDISDIYDDEWGVYKTYPYWIAKRNNMILTNLGVNGSTIISLVARGDYSAIPADCEYATIMIGLNDTTNVGEEIGDIDVTDTTTWYGCWNTIMSWLRTNRPHLHFGVLIVSAYMSEELRTATKNVCTKYGFPYLDMYNDPSVPAFMGKAGMDQTISDALYTVNKQSTTNGHPTLDCQKFMSTFIEAFIRKI